MPPSIVHAYFAQQSNSLKYHHSVSGAVFQNSPLGVGVSSLPVEHLNSLILLSKLEPFHS